MARENPFEKEEWKPPAVSGRGHWMRHPELGELFVPEEAYASHWVNGWRPFEHVEVERVSELQGAAAANAASDTTAGGVVEGATSGDNVSERRDAPTDEPPLPGSSAGLPVEGSPARQTKTSRRNKIISRKTV